VSIHERDTGLMHPTPSPFLPGKEGPGEEGPARLPALDLIRGVAILGILLANIPSFLGLIEDFGARPGNGSTGDTLVSALTLFFIDGKFITLFSILFGAGLAIQSSRAEKASRPFVAYYVRRMALLFGIGLAHFLLIWYGDILTSYAVVGLAALVLSHLGPRGIFGGLVVCFALAYFWLLGITLCFALFGDAAMKQSLGSSDSAAVRDEADQLDRPVSLLPDDTMTYEHRMALYQTPQNHELIYRSGAFGDMVLNRAIALIKLLCGDLLVIGWYLLGCFLLGITLLQCGLFQAPEQHLPLIRQLILFGFGIGIPCHVAAVIALAWNPDGAFSWLFNAWGALAQALGYLGLLLLWSRSGVAEWLQARLRAVGRLALTNYLMQSVLCGFLFYGYGLGLIGRVSRVDALGIVVAIWLLQLLLSSLWLRFFRMGPVEWLWRSLAEGRARPFLRPVGETA
jgi:uncharacterized protein